MTPRRWIAFWPRGATLPAAFYTDPRIAQLEDDLIFRHAWQVVGIEPELRHVGDYVTTEITGTEFSVPIVVLRDEDMQLRAFVNVCRHRAHFVAVGQGNRKTLQCSYHGWVYGLNGCLRGVPRAEEGGLPPFEQLGLYPLPLDTFGGYIFVCLEPRESLMEALGELPRELERVGFAFPFAAANADSTHLYARETSEFWAGGSAANWKVFLENTLECYHCPTTHTHSFSAMYKVDPEHYHYREFERGSAQWTSYQDAVAARLGRAPSNGTAPGAGGPDFQFYWLWPNMFFVGNGTYLRLWPHGVHAWKGEGISYAPRGGAGTDPALQQQFDEWIRLTLVEDGEVTARVQTGLRSGLYTWGYTLPESEAEMRHFYRMLWTALAPALRP